MRRASQILAIALLQGCADARQAPSSDATAIDSSGGRVLSAPAPNRDGKLRILLSHDMEGLSGQSDWRTFVAKLPADFKRGQALLAGDVNAVVDGLFAGGATEVDVFDQHGSGQPDSIPDLPKALLDPRAKHVFMSEAIDSALAARGNYDALVTVGEHAKTGQRGFASHTITLGIELVLNGMSVTEVELKAYQWGQFGVPLIFSSGDDHLQKDLAVEPWIEYVVVKRATSASTAELLPVDRVHAEMREKAKRAVERLAQSRVMRLTSPVTITVRAVPPATLALLERLPGVGYADQAVTFQAPSLDPKAFERILGIVDLATNAGHYASLREALGATAQGRALLSGNEDRYWSQWLDYESGRWKPK